MFLKLIFCTVIAMKATLSYCQDIKSKDHLQQGWLGYFNQSRFSGKWGLWLDLHLRTREDFVKDLSQSIARVGLTYYISDATKLTAGYAYVIHYPADNHKSVSLPEQRGWQQIQWHTKYGKQRMMQWIRLEEKFKRKVLNDSTLARGHSFNYKLRYNLWYEIPFTKKGVVPNSFSLVANDEVHINFGKEIVNNYFDQNRFFIGIKYQVNQHDNFQAGYMYVFQQLAAGDKYKIINAIRLFYFHNLDFRKKI
ncbi:MAG TPA: DUF2490 domain-containing protein [Ferruginibacter sp.]|nr:DUF2490 domain-containing protein [Ferruginibacter sp.]